MRKLFLVGLVLVAGCTQGVTDVGNPSINQQNPDFAMPAPTVAALIGSYGKPTVTSTSCTIDATLTPSIAATSDPTQIILNNFLDYGVSMRNILATYDFKSGAISFDISDASAAIKSCTGTASNGASGVVISLQCAPRSGTTDCQITYSKE